MEVNSSFSQRVRAETDSGPVGGFTSLEFRRVLGHLPTGVTVLTAFEADNSPIGMSANSVTSVSLTPPMILLCPARSSTTWPSIRAASSFCVNVMSSDHEELCRKFAAKRELGRFEGVTWHAHRSVPRLQGAIAWLNCRIWAEHDAGDHTVVIAQVDALDAGDGLPLVFFKGRYGTFT